MKLIQMDSSMSSMSRLELPRFPRGFLLSDRPVNPPPTFIPAPLLDNFYVHPWTRVEFAGDPNLFVIVIGHCLTTRPEQHDAPAGELLKSLQVSVAYFLRTLDDFGGRHAIIFGSTGNISIVNDATGMRSVFYAATGGIVASHAPLVEQALGGSIKRSDLPFQYGYPGNLTPFTRTKVLTPNTYYWLSANVIRRFWPIVAPAPRTVEEAATELLEASTNTFRAMSSGKSVAVTLTAGLDSRAILAVALNANVPFHTYTYGNQYSTKVDRLLAQHLAQDLELEHTEVSQLVDNPLLIERLNESHYSLHHATWVGPLMELFRHNRDVAILGNALEIGRSNYTPQRNNGAAPPVTAGNMADLHYRKIGNDGQQRVKEFGSTQFMEASAAAFQTFIDDTGFDVVAGMLDPFDHFYWEHRMATWQGVAMGERDFYAEAFIPYNSRRMFDAMLGAPFESRRQDAAAMKMIEMVDPRLMNFPVNPKTWSRAKAVYLGLLSEPQAID